MNWFKKETPKEAAMKAKRETRREVRVSAICAIRNCGGQRRRRWLSLSFRGIVSVERISLEVMLLQMLSH